ncbi:MAG: hypothetical protein GY847_27810 [Proteobacteria bacterium]|nr:hypothetical protein [Pseudomonadota bacterium]
MCLHTRNIIVLSVKDEQYTDAMSDISAWTHGEERRVPYRAHRERSILTYDIPYRPDMSCFLYEKLL